MKHKKRAVTVSLMVTCLLVITGLSGVWAAPVNLFLDNSVFLPFLLKQEPPPPTSTPEPTEEPTPVPTEEPTPIPTEEPTPGLLPVGHVVRFDVFEGTIVDAMKADQLEGARGTVLPAQVFVDVIVDVKNLGFVSSYVSRYDLDLADSLGRRFDMASLEAQWAAEDQFGYSGVYTDIQPSFVERQVYVFDIALDSEGLELLADTDPETPMPNPIPGSIINLGITGSNGNWEYTVTDVVKTSTLSGDYGTYSAKGIFLVTLVTVKNMGLESGYVSRFDFFIQDDLTRQFDMASLEVQWAAEDQYGRTGVYEDIQPSFTEDQVYVFDIYPTSSGLLFVPTDPGDAVDLGQ
jgi:hypothetical protein